MKTLKQSSIICILVYTLLNLACQALDPIPITKFSIYIDTSNVSYNTANVTSKFMDIGDDIFSYGHCWNTIENPTIDDYKTSFSGNTKKQVEFTSELSGLTSGTRYYVRAYCTTNNDILYSDQFEITTKSMSDRDGNIYKVVTIGTQIWMAENLKTTTYRNGDPIPTTNPLNLNLNDSLAPKYQWISNGLEENLNNYGRLYTWYAAADYRNVCPSGWHVPSDNDWKILEMALGMSSDEANGTSFRGTNEGSKLAGKGNLWWVGDLTSSAYFGTSGFNAVPGGHRFYGDATYQAEFQNLSHSCILFSSTEINLNAAWFRQINSLYSTIERNPFDKKDGFAVRCLKD